MTPSEEYYLKVRNKLDDLGYLQPLSFESVLLVDKLLEDFIETKKNLQHYKNVAQQSMEACSELQAGVGPYKEDNAKLIKENNDLRQKLLKAREAIEDTKVGPYRKRETSLLEKEHMLEKAQDKINNLTQEVTRLKSEQQELDEVIECLKNKVSTRDTEIERLSSLLSDGRPIMARNQCPCCSPQLLDCRLLTKNKQLSDQLEESKQKQHEAMIRAMELAERNQVLEDRRLPSARSDNSKKCCCAENSNKICKLQEKLEERILQVERLEQELCELKKTNAQLISDKQSVDKILEITIEDKKRMNDRINELTIIEHDLMLEIERLKRTNAMQKSQLAEVEARLSDLEQPNEKTKSQEKPGMAKSTIAVQKSVDNKRAPHTKKVIIKPVPVPPKATRPRLPPKKPTNHTISAPETDSSTLSSTGPVTTVQDTSHIPKSAQRPCSPIWIKQLLEERKKFEQQLEEMAKQQAEHCAKYHPPPCPRSARNEPTSKETDLQWLLLERVQAERDYYHKEFSRLRDQLCNIPDHSTEATKGPTSPHQKLERLLSERNYYHKEMCRLMESTGRIQAENTALNEMKNQLLAKQDEVNVLQGKLADLQHRLSSPELNSEMLKRISAKEEDIKTLSEKIRELEHQMMSNGPTQLVEDLRRKLNLKDEEVFNLRERLKDLEKTRTSQDQQQSVGDLWRKLNQKEEEILTLREKIRDMEKNQVALDFTQTNAELWRRLNLKEDELSRMQDKIKSVEQNISEYSLLKRKYNQKEEENLSLREQIREYECNRYNSSGMSQVVMTRLEMERDAANGDCLRLREENNAIRNDMQRLKECQRDDQIRLEQAKKDFDSCVSQFEVERQALRTEIKQLTEELRQFKDRLHELQADAGEHRTRSNHLKMVNEQTERELRTTQDLLQQTETELASALDRIQELNEEIQRFEWQLKETKQEKCCLKSNMTRLDQEKDALLLKVDEKTEQNVRLEAELESRDRRIASLEGFIADLQKKLDVALDTAARSEQTSRQHVSESDRLRKELDKMERCRDNAVKENSRLQNDLAAVTHDHQQTSRALEAARREIEDLKLQLQGYVAEARRITKILEEKEAERMAMLEHYRSLTVESANLETNNHSLESEAKSTKSCLREAHTRIQDLEATLEEKKAMVHGYEKQIKELTHQVAKLERKLNSRSRAESATRDLSQELESQKHCLSQKVNQLTCDNKQREEEIRCLRSELADLKDQLGRERKNSATLENVLASSRQETLQRSKDNSELKVQVHCLQSKLTDLKEKLEHGSEALHRCQSECADYQAQVAELRREVTNERFEHARVQETRASRSVRRLLKGAAPRSRSLTSLHSLIMTPYICPCCFLNRISILRNAPEASRELINNNFEFYLQNNNYKDLSPEHVRKDVGTFQNDTKNSDDKKKVYSEISTTVSDVSIPAYPIDSGNFTEDSQEYMLPERLINNSKNAKSSATFTVKGFFGNQCLINDCGKQFMSATTVDSMDRAEMLAEQIDSMLKEQKKFLKELDLPIQEEGCFRLDMVQTAELQSRHKDNYIKLKQKITKNNKNKRKSSKKLKTDTLDKDRTKFYASGDQNYISKINRSDKNTTLSIKTEENKQTNKRVTIHFNDEPVKLTKLFEWELPPYTNFNKDHGTTKNTSVKLLFFPENELQCSNSSIDSNGENKPLTVASSVYVTAPNSSIGPHCESFTQLHAVYTMADSSSSNCLGEPPSLRELTEEL